MQEESYSQKKEDIMVDLGRLLKKAFIVNKQGFREFGSEAKSEKKESKDKSHPTIENFFSFQRDKPKPAMPRESGNYSRPWSSSFPSISKGGPSPRGPATTGIYIFLIIISAFGLLARSFVAYSPGKSFAISIILALFFFFGVRNTPEPKVKEGLVALTLGLDFAAQFVLGTSAGSAFENKMITLYVFAWVILAVILFLMGVLDTTGAGERLGKPATVMLILVLGTALFFLLPVIIQSPSFFQDVTHAEYFHIAKSELVKVAGTLDETKNFWYDYFTCTFSVFDGSLKYESCMENKRIGRYCEANFQTTADKQNCVLQQQELVKQGARPGIAGVVSDAIKQVTKVEMKEDQYFPKKATDSKTIYPIPLKVENPREQTFTAKVSCEFKGFTAKGEEKVPGIISIGGEEVNEVQINSKAQEYLIGCQPSADLKGRYTLDYTVMLSGMQTFSFIKRAFVSKEIDPKLRGQIEMDNFKTKADRTSQGPAEFALLNFKFGSGDGSSPLVTVEDPVTFSFAVEDVGTGSFKGEVQKINSYNFHGLWERGFNVDSEKIGDKDCLQGGEVLVNAALTKKREPSELRRCFLSLPADFSQLQKNAYKIETFVADLNYDYKITKSIPVEVTPLVVVS